MKAVVVEDDEVSLKVVEKILSKHGIGYISHKNALSALTYFQHGGEADIVISDVMMPEMNGFELIQSLRDSKRTINLPVILCTALNDQQSVMKGIKLGISDYVTKPINEQTLIGKIEKAMEAQRLVLIVDPDKTVGDLIENILHNNGLATLRATGGEEAIREFEGHRISMVITANDLEDLKAEDLIKTLKSKNRRLPVMIISGKHNKKSALDMGADGLIKKPFHNIDILTQVKKLIRV